MQSLIYCLVDADGNAHLKSGATSYSEVAAACRLDEKNCQKYHFDLTSRRLLQDCGRSDSDPVAQRCFDQCVGTPERLMAFAEEGRLPKDILVSLLQVNHRSSYLDGCAAFERQCTERCTAANDPCLESGCAVEEEVCLEPLLRAEREYRRACGAEWIKWFASPGNRIEPWKR